MGYLDYMDIVLEHIRDLGSLEGQYNVGDLNEAEFLDEVLSTVQHIETLCYRWRVELGRE